MERASVLILVFLQLFMFFTEDGLAIRCYKCDGTNCNDPFVSSGVTTCTGQFCIKGKGTYLGMQYVIRSCSDDAVVSNSCWDTTISEVKATGCACKTDWCNDSIKVGGLSGLIIILSIGSLAFLLKFH